MAQTVKKILKINSSGRSDGSVSRKLVQRAVNRLTSGHPDAAIIERDVSSGLPVVDETWIGANFTPGEARTSEQERKLEFSNELIEELRTADVIVIGVPIYNFGVPASLKQWVDLIARAGETFSYSESGPKGLLEGKRAIVAVTSGGVETGSPAHGPPTRRFHLLTLLQQGATMPDFHDLEMTSITGEPVSLANFKENLCLVVNVASR